MTKTKLFFIKTNNINKYKNPLKTLQMIKIYNKNN